MALEEQTELRTVIDPDGTIFIDEITRVLKDGRVIGEGVHRKPYNPGDDVSALPPGIAKVAEMVWTPDVIQRHKDREAAILERQRALLAKHGGTP